MPDEADPAGDFLRNLQPSWKRAEQEIPIPPIRPVTQVPAEETPIFSASGSQSAASSSKPSPADGTVLKRMAVAFQDPDDGTWSVEVDDVLTRPIP